MEMVSSSLQSGQPNLCQSSSSGAAASAMSF
jgi:hypothetical protein